MKRVSYPLLALAAPLLITLSLIGLMYRQGSDRQQSVPALLVGVGLVVSGVVGRGMQRRKLFWALRSKPHDEK